VHLVGGVWKNLAIQIIASLCPVGARGEASLACLQGETSRPSVTHGELCATQRGRGQSGTKKTSPPKSARQWVGFEPCGMQEMLEAPRDTLVGPTTEPLCEGEDEGGKEGED